MSLLGSTFGRAISGVGQAASGLANKYIDEELAARRAQTMADIQRTSAVQQVKDIDQYQNDPARRENLRSEASKDTEAANATALKGKVAEASSPELRQARIDDRVGFLQGTTQAEIDAENAKLSGTSGTKLDAERIRAKVMTPLEIERARGIAEAQWSARALYDERLEGKGASGKGAKMSEAGKIQLQDLAKQDEALTSQINKGVAEGSLKSSDPNDPAWRHLQQQKQSLQVQKMRVFAREGLIDGAQQAGDLIAAGASVEDLTKSKQQAQMIGGDYAREFGSAVDAHLARQPKGDAKAPAAPGVASAAGAPVTEPEGFMARAWRSTKSALAPDLNNHVESAILGGQRQQIEWLLNQPDAEKPLTADSRRRLEAALKSARS